jgi:prepilin-type N-terminal cleavage/methylation domain-containing protein
MRPSKCAFTLLEIVLVIAILSMMATVIGWQIGKCVNSYAFEQEVEMLYNTFKQSQVLAVTYRTDITIHFFREKGAYYFFQKTSEPFAESLFDREKKKLKEIKKINLDDKLVKQFSFTLYSQGNFEPRVKLNLCSKNAKKTTWLDSQGGFLLSLSSKEPNPFKIKPVFPEEKLKKFLIQKQQPKPLTTEKHPSR